MRPIPIGLGRGADSGQVRRWSLSAPASRRPATASNATGCQRTDSSSRTMLSGPLPEPWVFGARRDDHGRAETAQCRRPPHGRPATWQDPLVWLAWNAERGWTSSRDPRRHGHGDRGFAGRRPRSPTGFARGGRPSSHWWGHGPVRVRGTGPGRGIAIVRAIARSRCRASRPRFTRVGLPLGGRSPGSITRARRCVGCRRRSATVLGIPGVFGGRG